VVADLLGDTTHPANAFISDVYPNGYDNGSAGLAVQSDQAVAYEEAAEALAATAVTTHMGTLIGTCDPAAQGDATCFQAFLTGFAPRAYRRPLTPTEQQRLSDVFSVGEAAGGFSIGLRTALETVLQSPEFLYREELGPLGAAADAGPQTVALTDYEMASELSFLLTGSMPDNELWTAVSSGTLHTTNDYLREAERLLASPRARGALRSFLHEWMATDRLGTLTKMSFVYPTFNLAMGASMSQELDQFYDDVLWTRGATLRALLTSNQGFVDQTLATLYGFSVAKLPATGFTSALLDPTLRAGILTRAGYLAVHAASDSSGPIARGVFLMQAILCTAPPPPPPNVPPAPKTDDPRVAGFTTRQRFALHASVPACATCHTIIDGFGFGFEEFDGLGAYRTMDNGQAVDTTGTILGTGDIDGPFSGVTDLEQKLLHSQRPLDCFTKQAYRFAMGQVENPTDDLTRLSAGFSVDAPMTAVLVTLVTDPVFATRAFETSGP
jgi:hypothetical protein